MAFSMRLLAATAALVVMAAPAAAQGFGLSITPKIGAFAPLSDLGEVNGQTQELEGSLAVGLAAELGLPMLPFDLRANFDYATDTKVDSQGVGEPGSAEQLTLLAFTGDLVFRRAAGVLQPYLLAGAGFKKYDVEREDVQSGAAFDDNDADLTGHVGAGLGLALGLLTIDVELSDYISSFDLQGESELQHDLFLMVGARVGLF